VESLKPCKTCRAAPRQFHSPRCKKCEDARLRAKKKAAEERAKLRRKAHKERPAALVKKLDAAFSKFIRERDKGKPCVTCGKPWEPTFQCGHFLSRRHMATRWHKENAHGQCPGCNMFEGGRQFEHGLAVDALHGQGKAQELLMLSRQPFKRESAVLKIMLDAYEA
jgi:hypothetical protein